MRKEICICDICKKNEADYELMYQGKKRLLSKFIDYGWTPIDICLDCITKFEEARKNDEQKREKGWE